MPDTTARFVTRFAPSPTGYIHLGTAYAAIMAHRAARDAGGTFLLRIEDTDQTRCRPEFEDALYEDLAWLGIAWDGTPRRQSDHFDEYDAALQALVSRGLAYRCFMTRKDIAAAMAKYPERVAEGPDGPAWRGAPLPPETELALLAEGKPFAWRLSMDAAQATLGARFDTLTFTEQGAGPAGEQGEIRPTPAIFGDPVLARKDTGTSYHLACTHDDALQGITHVVRGADLFAATHLHRLLQELMGWPVPLYRHHGLILDEDGRKYSKRDRALTIRALREAGETPDSIRRTYLGL